MKTMLADPAAFAVLSIAVKGSVLLVLTVLAHWALRRRASAASRHLVCAAAVVGVLLLPALWLVLPTWSVEVRSSAAVRSLEPTRLAAATAAVLGAPVSLPASRPTPRADGDARRIPDTVAWSPRALVGTIYVLGVVVLMLHLLTQHWRILRLLASATPLRDAEWMRLLDDCARLIGVRRRVRLLQGRPDVVPLTFGFAQPTILIPPGADSWTDGRRRAVLLHELAHVARRDCLTQTLACVARAIYWFNPAAWWLVRRLRVERELACDDRVIAAGTEPRDYAGHLLEIAYSLGARRIPAIVVGMARPGQLEGRMLAALDSGRNRRPPSWRLRAVGITIAAGLVGMVASAAPAVVPEDDPGRAQTAAAQERARSAVVPVVPGSLHAIEWPLVEEVRRLVMDGASVLGLAEDAGPGTWELRLARTTGMVHLRLGGPHWSHGSDVPIERLDGLSSAQLAGAGGAVRFRLRRDAGTFEFEGVVRNGVGAGTFSFTADQGFADALAKRGFARPAASDQYQLALSDIGYAFLDELDRQGYAKPHTADLVRAGQHGVNATYLRDMGALGYRLGTLEPAIVLRDHGVEPDYVRALASLGYTGLPADDLRKARDHGVTPEYVEGMRKAGYASLAMQALIGARDHGVTTDFVRELQEAGYRSVPLEQLIRTRDHGVTPEYIRGMAGLGYGGLPLDSLVRLRDHGVTPEYAKEVKALGYDRIGPEDLVMFRDHGLTPDRIRAANARGGTPLSIEQLQRFAEGGFR